jgi:pimeloyl-ACP methyl ester carboxylesterase
MALLEKISLKAATRFALYLFYRPIKFPVPEREKAIRESATRHNLSTGKSDFTYYEWGSAWAPKKVLLVHGWSGRGTQFHKIIKTLIHKGYYVGTIDAPGHGENSQKHTDMLEFTDAINVIEKQFGPFDYAVGHSLGGMAIFNALLSNLQVGKIVTIGTPDNISHVVRDFCSKVNASHRVAEGILKYIEKHYKMKPEEASTDYLATKFNPAGLIIHDENDQDVGVENALELAKHWPNANLIVTQGLGHRKVLMEQKIIDAIIGFLPLS